jgi:hypothetical protein
MLSLLMSAQITLLAQNLPSSLSVTPSDRSRLHYLLQKRQRQQLEQKLNTAQRRYEMRIQDFKDLPSSRIDCFPISTPVPGVDPDPISCSRP